MDIQSIFDRSIPEPNSGRWLWFGAVRKDGYVRRGSAYAHRQAYEAARGPIPAGLEIDHLCRVRCCVNPDHLEPVTSSENSLRSHRGRVRDNSVCQYGHDLEVVGTYRRKDRPNSACMECARASRRRYARSVRRAA